MFSSPCSLRSTQCATLIALAAAAGLMRVETNNSAESGPASEPRAESFERSLSNNQTAQTWSAVMSIHSKTLNLSSAVWTLGPAPYGEALRLNTAARDSRRLISLLQITVPMSDAADLAVFPVPSLASQQRPAYFNSSFPVRSSRQHVFPFAVGPPYQHASSNPRADDTRVSGDLAVCGRLVVRVANSHKLSLIARTTRDPNRATKLAGLFSRPSFALRGKPESLDQGVIGLLRALKSACHHARINSSPV